MRPTFEDYFIVGNTDGFHQYAKTDISTGDTWYLGIFETDNTIVPRDILATNNTDITMLLVGGGGGGGRLPPPFSGSWGGGGGGGGHLLIQTQVSNNILSGLPVQSETVYDITVGKGGPSLSDGTYPGGPTLFGYRQYGSAKCPEVSGGKNGNNNPPGQQGGIISTGENVGFTLLNSGSGGVGGVNGSISGQFGQGGNGGNATHVTNTTYGDPSQPAYYYIGPKTGPMVPPLFGDMSVGGGGGGGGGNIGQPGNGGQGANGGVGGAGGIFPASVPPIYEGTDATYSINAGPANVMKCGGGGGGVGYYTSGNYTGGNGADGIFMIWFIGPPISTAPTYSFDTPYYTLNYSESALATNQYDEVVFPNTRKVGYYTSVIVGGKNANITFKPLFSGVSAELLLVGGGGGGGGGSNVPVGFNGYMWPGSGGGGGGHLYGYGIGSSQFTIGSVYDISLGNGGIGEFGETSGTDGEESVFGLNQWGVNASRVSGGGGGGAKTASGTVGVGGNIVNVGNLTQLYGGTGGDGGSGADTYVHGDNEGYPGYPGANAANGVGGSSGSYSLTGFGTVTVGGGGGGGGGARTTSFSVSAISGDGGGSGMGIGGTGGTGYYNFNTVFYRGQNATQTTSSNSAIGGGGGGGGGLALKNAGRGERTFGGDGGAGVFAVRVTVVLSPGTSTLTPIANLEPYITTSSPIDFTAYSFEIPYADGSHITWYLGVFEGNNNITPNGALDDIDVNLLMVGGGGGGAGGTNVTQAVSGGGGGGGGHMLIRATAGEPQLQIGTSYSIQVGSAGVGGVGLSSGGDGGHTTFGSNIVSWAGQFPDVSGGGGGGNITRGDFGLIVRTGASLGFEVLNDVNVGGGGQGGLGSQGSFSGYQGGNGGNAATVTDLYGNPSYPGWYYVGPSFGSIFGLMKVSGAGGGGGGNYDLITTEPLIHGQGGFAGNQGVGGFGGNYVNGVQPITYSNGENAPYAISIGSYTSSYVGAGGGGAGQPGTGLNSTGGSGVKGTFMIWFAVPDPVIYETPYYSLACVNSIVADVSNEHVFYDGSKKTYYTSVVTGGLYNSIKFLSAANGIVPEILLVGGGGGGGGGMNQNYTYAGQGGGGGGHILGSGTVGSTFAVDVSYNIELGNGGQNGGGANPGADGDGSYFGRNVWSPYTYVTAGGGGGSANPFGQNGYAGDISNNGQLTYIRGGTGGAGGVGGPTSYPNVVDGYKGGDAAVGNTDISGLYVFPGYGAIGVAGGGGGGGGLQSFTKYPDISGQGGFAGFGIGGFGGESPYYGTSYNGVTSTSTVTTGYAIGGGGGGGGGIPYDPSSVSIQSQGGRGGDGLFAVHLEIETPAPPPPVPEPGYANEYFAFDNSNADLFIKWLDPSATCLCGGTPSLEYIAITTADNVLRFLPGADGMPVDFLLVGAGGQGGGSINSVVRHPGQGGAGGGIAYATGTVGGNVAYDVSYNIEIGYNTQLGGYAVYDGTDGSGSRFGANVWTPWMEVSGGGGGGVLSPAGTAGTVVSYGPLTGLIGGSGGDGGLQFDDGNGSQGGNAVNGTSGLSGKFAISGYGTVTCAGGGGGGAGISGEDTYGSGGMAGRGEGGHGGTIGGHDNDGADGETLVEDGLAYGGGGGGGAGMTQLSVPFQESVASGGDGARGLFMMFLHRPSDCNPIHPICGCQTYDAICGCGILSKCPTPVEYIPLNTGGNDPKINPAIAYAAYIRGSLGRPGYQRYQVGNQPLNPFGSYAGAPGGSRAPPRNKFG